MKHLIDTIENIANNISSTEKSRKNVSDFLRNNNEEFHLINEAVKKNNISLKIAAVDGGIVNKSVHGFDFVLIRAGGVCFKYKDGKMENVKHIPSKFPPHDSYAFNNLSDSDWRNRANILRQKAEISLALKLLEEGPDVLLLDGSIVPHQAYKNGENTELYNQMIDDYNRLYESCISSGVKLIGVVEDSRSTVFCDLVKDLLKTRTDCSVLDITRDTSLLYLLLNKKERTFVMSYSKDPVNHPTLKDIKNGKNVYSIYLKTAEWDRPIRLDFLSQNDPEKQANEISSIILAISGQHSGYGIPSPIIEADNIAKLSEKEMENFYSQILSKTGKIPSMMNLRRESRPF